MLADWRGRGYNRGSCVHKTLLGDCNGTGKTGGGWVAYRERLKTMKGKLPVFTESGPASMGLIEEIFTVLKDQEQRIKELEAKSGASK